MTEGHGTCGLPIGGRKRPQRGRTTSRLAPVRPLWGRLEREGVSYPQVPFPSVIPPAVIHIRPLWGRLEREGVSYPQVTFPSVIPPAVIYIRPRWGRREYLVQVVYLVSIR